MTLHEKLAAIQSQIKAPKDKSNDFGGYKYRSAEQIFEAFKPFGAQYKLVLTVSDDVVPVGSWVYVKATATLTDVDNPSDTAVVTAWAREQDTRKGMDAAQVTGSASSYARKYALNGLFLLDDTKDPDTMEYRQENDARRQKAEADDRAELIEAINNLTKEKGYGPIDGLEKATIKQLAATLKKLQNAPKRGAMT